MGNEMKRHIEQFNLLITEIDNVYHDAALKLGLSDSAMTILYTICSQGEACPLSDITQMSGVRKQTINSALRKLEGEGIVYLEMSGVRKKRVCLTEKGKELAASTVLRLLNMENDILISWSEEERNLYLELTRRYLITLKEKVKEL